MGYQQNDDNSDARDEGGEAELLLDRSGNGIATITLNRPRALNALTHSLITRLARVFQELDQSPDVKVIVLTGSGRAFSTGVDLTAAQTVFQGDVKDEGKDVSVQMDRCSKPIIGAINGHCITAGFEIALACDILIASSNAQFVDTHCKFGIFPSWGLSQKLPRIIGPVRARELSLAAVPLDAYTAERWGLVSRVVAPDELMNTARGIAEAILKNQQGMVIRYKAVSRDGLKLSLGEALKLEKDRAHEYYANMRPEDFSVLQQFIAGRSSKQAQLSAKL